jgi:micrococcal nuclease
VFADAPGNDNRNTNGEYVTLSNSGVVATEIAGWTLCEGASLCFTFPSGASIPGNGSVRLYTGSGRNTDTSFYMGHGRAVWNNEHDTATLRSGGTVIAQDIY